MSPDPDRIFEIRCPIHGFVMLNSWERDIIEQRPFQRLRRIRQLAWTDYVYPGAMHTRFEHSLGVMHTASLLYDSIRRNSIELLKSELAYNETGLDRHSQLVRLVALLHDVGHAPFSHAGEGLLPEDEDGQHYTHESYSAAIVRQHFEDVIENHPMNKNCGFRAEDVASLLEGSQATEQSLFWRDLLVGQMDADRMDYLLRDSHHIGVRYGTFDLHRLVATACVVPGAEGQSPRLGVSKGGWHSAEALVLARYFMFTQVYFHKTRVAYDIHLLKGLAELLPDRLFPPPDGSGLDEFLKWDDWRVLGLLQQGKGGEHCERLANRDHFRWVYETPEIPSQKDLDDLQNIREGLGDLLAAEQSATKSWYKTGDPDIQVFDDSGWKPAAAPLSKYSNVVKNLGTNNQIKLFSKPENVQSAVDKISNIEGGT